MNLSNIILTESELGRLFLSILFLLISSHSLGTLFNRFYLPRVIGEILGGILLGPSCLGFFFPKIYSQLFNFFPAHGNILSFLYWTGLAFLMLSTGFKIDNSLNFKDQKVVINLIISATLLPTLGGILYYYLYDFSFYRGSSGTDLSMMIILCVAISVTSIPVISKIFIDLGIIETRFAKIVLAASMLQDLILWAALAVATQTVSNKDISIISIIITTLLFLTVSLFFGPSFIHYLSHIKKGVLLKSSTTTYIIVVFLCMIVIANFLKVNIAFGALIGGIILSKLPKEKFHQAKNSITEVSLSFFVPLYFSIVGLKINLPTSFDLNLLLSFLFISSFLEIGSVMLGLKFFKNSWLTSLNFGFAMNTRGGPGIILASVAYEFSIINETFFVVLILVSIITSLLSGAWFKYVLNRDWSLCET